MTSARIHHHENTVDSPRNSRFRRCQLHWLHHHHHDANRVHSTSLRPDSKESLHPGRTPKERTANNGRKPRGAGPFHHADTGPRSLIAQRTSQTRDRRAFRGCDGGSEEWCDCRAARRSSAAGALRRAPVKIRTSNLLIRSQMLYPVELRALQRMLISGGRERRQIAVRPWFFRLLTGCIAS